MVQTLKAQNIDLGYLIETFGLQRLRDEQFFGEWQADLPELTESEKQGLDRVQEGYSGSHLDGVHPVLEVRSQEPGVEDECVPNSFENRYISI